MAYIIFWRDGKKEYVEANNGEEAKENSAHKKENPSAEVDFCAHTNFKSYISNSFDNFVYYPQEKKWYWA